jgi:hypothetical protein
MASSLLNKLGNAAVRRAVEEIVEKYIREGLAAGEDENAITKKILHACFGPTSALATIIRAVPGGSFAPHMALSVAAEYMTEHADEILPGDNRRMTRLVRETLKYAAPALEGVGNASADVLQRIDDSVDQTRSASTVAPKDRVGVLDNPVYVWMVNGERHLIYPMYSGKDIQADELGDPIPTNLSGALLELWMSERFTKRGTKKIKGKDGKDREVPVNPEKRTLSTRPLDLGDAIVLRGGVDRLSSAEAEELRRLFAPKPSWENRISPRVDRVINWIVDTLSFPALGLTSLERQEMEDLVQKMKTKKPDPEWVNRRLGRFEIEVKRFPLNRGRVYTPDQIAQMKTLLARIRDEIDITLEGEQSGMTQIRKGLAAAPDVYHQVKQLFESSKEWVKSNLKWWYYSAIASVVLLVLGIIIPVAMFDNTFVTLVSYSLAVIGGILGFAITWPVPLVQKVYDFIGNFLPGHTPDSINSLGRRVASFALCVGAGLLPMLIWLQVPVLVRLGLVALAGLFPIGITYALREAGYPATAFGLVKRSLLLANFAFGTLGVLLLLAVGLMSTYSGHFMTGPEFVKAVWGTTPGHTLGDQAVGAWGSVTGSWFGLIVLLGIGVSLTSLTLARLQILRGGTMAVGNPIAKWMMWMVAIAGLIWILKGAMAGPPAASSTPSRPATSSSVQTAPQQDNGPWFDRTALCNDPRTSYDQRKTLRCP